MSDGPELAHNNLTLTLIVCVSAVINISLNDLLNATDVVPTAANRPADAAAFTGLLDQFDRQQQAEAPAKPARARAERATTSERDDETAKSNRRAAPSATSKAKAPETAARDEAAPAEERPVAQESASAKPAADSANQDERTEAAAKDSIETLTIQTPVVIVAEQPVAPLTLNGATADDAVSAISGIDSATAETPVMPLADGEAEATAGKSKALAPQIQAAEAAQTAAADETTQPLTLAQQKAAAQAADLGKQLDNLPMQIAVQLTTEESAKPLKAAVSLANGMNHATPNESVTATQTASAAPSVDNAAAPTAKAAEPPTLQTVASAQSATPAFAAMVASAADRSAPTVAKTGIGEPAAVGGLAAASGATSATATASTSTPIKPAPLPHPATEQVAVHIAKASAEGVDKINVKLKPAALGNVEVQIDLASDGRVQVVVSADRADTLDLLQRDARGLERALTDAGLQTDQQSFSFNLRDQNTPNGNGGGDAADRMGWHGGAEGADEALPAVGGYLNARAAVGGVDIRV